VEVGSEKSENEGTSDEKRRRFHDKDAAAESDSRKSSKSSSRKNSVKSIAQPAETSLSTSEENGVTVATAEGFGTKKIRPEEARDRAAEGDLEQFVGRKGGEKIKDMQLSEIDSAGRTEYREFQTK
jgi:hypothetical protein